MHKSDQITRAGLERLMDYCKTTHCNGCSIREECKLVAKAMIGYMGTDMAVPSLWTDSDITDILKTTRNYMEQVFIESLEKLVATQGVCHIAQCRKCPLSRHYDMEGNPCGANNILTITDSDKTYEETKEIAEWLLDIYRGEVER